MFKKLFFDKQNTHHDLKQKIMTIFDKKSGFKNKNQP